MGSKNCQSLILRALNRSGNVETQWVRFDELFAFWVAGIASDWPAMVAKIFAVIAVLVLPLNLFFWHRSHSSPVYFRSDISQYRSLTIYLREGVIGMYLLTMPTPAMSSSEFQADLHYDATPSKGNLHLSSIRIGDLTKTWLVFPFWLSTALLLFITFQPVVFGPVRQIWRRIRGRCMFCGYDLTGNRSGRCSECGEHVQHNTKRPHPAIATRR